MGAGCRYKTNRLLVDLKAGVVVRLEEAKANRSRNRICRSIDDTGDYTRGWKYRVYGRE